jgi:hypothetical protein
VNRDHAAQIDRLTREASQLLDESIQPVRAACTPKAAGVYTSAIGRVMGEMSAGVLFPLWREHPDLEPKGLREPGAYDARAFEMPGRVADEALAALAKARHLMESVRAIIAEVDPGERQAYGAELESVFAALDAAVRGVEMRRKAPE